MTHPLEGIWEKLKRADQCINDLDSEITPFLAKFPTFDFPITGLGISPPFTDEQQKAWKQFGLNFLEAERSNTLPLRFSVLAGEIVHHLRSCLDHLVWQLSDDSSRNDRSVARYIEFPIFDTDPAQNPNKTREYGRKVKGITNSPLALTRIEMMQPYKSTDPLNTALWRIHDMDKTDKHRELTIVVHTPGAHFEARGLRPYMTVYQGGVPIGEVAMPGIFNVEVNAKIAPYIAFGKANKGELEPVIPFLKQLHRFMVDVINSFAAEFR